MYILLPVLGHSKLICVECVKQQLTKLINLQAKLCTSNHNLGSFSNGFLWTGEVTGEELTLITSQKVVHVFRPLPTNVDMMRRNNYQYKFKHTHYDCSFKDTFMGCFQPHSEGEDTQWNTWKREGKTPVKLHDSAVAEYEKCELCTKEI